MEPVGAGEAAVERLVRDGYPRLVRAVALACGSTAAAEEAVLEALARAWEQAAGGGAFDHLEGWVLTVALNGTRRNWRRAQRHTALTELAAATVPEPDAALVDLRTAVAALPRRQREAVVLHYYLGYPVDSVAAVVGIAPGTVKNALFRARRTLGRALGDSPTSEVRP
jgi:RNA polymerase sigma-70 factor (ECF subfamily)